MQQPKISEIASGKLTKTTSHQASEPGEQPAAETISSYERNLMRTRLASLKLEIDALIKLLDNPHKTFHVHQLQPIKTRLEKLTQIALGER